MSTAFEYHSNPTERFSLPCILSLSTTNHHHLPWLLSSWRPRCSGPGALNLSEHTASEGHLITRASLRGTWLLTVYRVKSQRSTGGGKLKGRPAISTTGSSTSGSNQAQVDPSWVSRSLRRADLPPDLPIPGYPPPCCYSLFGPSATLTSGFTGS